MQTAEERFWVKVEKQENGCWLWTAAHVQEPKPYGQFWYEGRKVLAHRFSYELLVGPIPEGLEIDHLCRVHRCVNPAHLEPVTRSVNILRGRNPCRERTHCPHGHPYDETNTRWAVLTTGKRNRKCRTCNREEYHRRPRALAALDEPEGS